MRDTRRYLMLPDGTAVLADIAGRLLAQEWHSVPDGVRQQISDEVSAQSAQLLAEAGAEYTALEERRVRAVRAYGRPDPVVCVVAGILAGYLFLFIGSMLFWPGLDPPGVGLLPVGLAVLVAALAVRWRPWRRRAALIRSVPEAYQRWTAVLEGLLRSFIVASLNDEARNYDVRIGERSAPRLVEAIEPRPVDSAAMALVRTTAQSVHSGSLGVSGPRGAGKSTILQFFDADQVAPGIRAPAGQGRDEGL